MSQMQVVSARVRRKARLRPFGVTLIALYEFLLIGLMIYGLWIVFAAHFALRRGASGSDPLVEYFTEIFVFAPFSLISHVVAGVGLWFVNSSGRFARMAISSANVYAYTRGRIFFVWECLPQHHYGSATADRVLSLDILIFLYLWLYPAVRENFARETPE